MSKKVLFEVRERSTDGAFQVVEDDGGELQLHFGATYLDETPTHTALKVGPDNSITANVNHRTGLLGDSITGLLSLPGGAGEIAVATDVDALVTYTGVAGEATAFYRSGQIGTFSQAGPTDVTAVPSGTTGKVVTFIGGRLDTPGFLAAGGNNVNFVVPATSAKRCFVELIAGFYFGFTDSGTGTVRNLVLQYDPNNNDTWLDVASVQTIPAAGVSTTAGGFAIAQIYPLVAGAESVKFRLVAKQDSGAALDLTINKLIIKMYRA